MIKNIRLTNDMRDTFIAKVMADVPSKPYEDEVRDTCAKAAVAALPPAVRKLHKDPELGKFIGTHYVTLYSTPIGSISFSLPGSGRKSIETLLVEATAEIVPAWAAQVQSRKGLTDKLRAVAYHCTTRNQLAEAFPEFAQYLPAIESDATRNLPALANVVTDFVKAGWPKGGKQAKAVAA